MEELSNTLYKNKYLVLRKVGSSENVDRISSIIKYFKKFKKVYIFNDIEYLDELKKHNKVKIVNNNDFLLKLNGIIIYHYSGYYRVWENYDEKNLEIYDIYKYPVKRKEGKK